jgi:hypothetical protein
MNCDQCEMLSINGVACHESGCPNRNSTWDEDRQRWIQFRECRECAERIELGEVCECQTWQPEPDPLDQSDNLGESPDC